MRENAKTTFEEIVKQNEKRIYYQLKRLGINDYEGEFYAEGLYAMWMAYEKYDVNKGPMATYFNFSIRNRMIDLIRKKVNEREKEEIVIQETMINTDRYYNPLTIVENKLSNETLLKKVKTELTEKQKKWVYYAIFRGYTQKEIAHKENVTLEAVKSWAKETKRKLRQT